MRDFLPDTRLLEQVDELHDIHHGLVLHLDHPQEGLVALQLQERHGIPLRLHVVLGLGGLTYQYDVYS